MMSLLVISVPAIVGISLGSFLNVLIWRLNDEDAPRFWQGRSVCPNCRHDLNWKDNVPLISFIVLGGRCRYCRQAISWQYPAVELVTALTTIILWHSPALLLIAYCFIVIFFSDLKYGLIPDEMIVGGVVASAIYNFQFTIFNQFLISNFKFQILNLGQNLLIGLLSGLGFLLVVVITRFRGMGLGDVKLAFLMGFLLGWPKAAVAFWSAFVVGGVVAVGLVLLKKTKLSATIPLGPFLVAGTIFAALWTNQLLQLLGL